MSKRQKIATGMAGGFLWSVLLIWVAVSFVQLPVFALMPTIMSSFIAPGLVMLAMVARLAQKRFFDDEMIDGTLLSGSAVIDQRVLTNTTEQLVLAMCIWPAAAVILGGKGPGLIACLGLGFAIARLIFWAGCHRSISLRAFGFAASFYPTVLVALWSVWQLAFGFS